ncbi:hypothetical protein [Microbacterium sp. YY-01]|uniref:hypothetical protein n=1 Tax=Microbacterium sp. YY-01 TaxID=3421634 RepID=UPI003D183ADB
MGGPVLSGGVIVLVAALLWLLYFLPSLRGSRQFYAAEKNAVRLNQALRVLAETSETPAEVRVELNTRTVYAQQKLARRVQAEREAQELQALRAELAAVRADPAVKQARARRTVRLVASTIVLLGLVGVSLGVWQLLAAGSSVLLWVGSGCVLLGAVVLQRMAAVASRAAVRAAQPAVATAPRVSPPLHDQGPARWTPREVPQSLTAQAGTRAHAARVAAEAQQALRDAARAEALRERAEQMAPPEPERLAPDAAEHAAAPASTPAADSPYARMGYVDDAEIEAHVRALLARRSVG